MDREAVREVFLPRREDCLEYLRKKGRKERVKGPYWGSSKVWTDGYTQKSAKKYECCGGGRDFHDWTRTIFEDHHFPIEEMEAKSTLQIAEEWGRDGDSGLRLVHGVHEWASQDAQGIALEGVVEGDEVDVHAGERMEKVEKDRRRGLRKRGRGTWEGDPPLVRTIVKRGRSRKFDFVG